jgi:glycosyltransferase involved in cell wall biosynthesis
VDAFIAVSEYYASEMKLKMKIPENKIIVIPIGIETDLYTYSEPVFNPPVLAFLSRLNHENGFEIFSDAFILLKKNVRFKNVKAKISGGYTSDDKSLIHRQISKFKRNGILNDIEFVEDFDKESRSRFFENTTLLSVPVLKGEAFGTYQLESLACGTPLVQPNLGAFGEIAEKTGGGLTYNPNTAESLCNKWMELLSKPEEIIKMAQQGQKSVNQNYTNIHLSEKVLDVYQKAILNEI